MKATAALTSQVTAGIQPPPHCQKGAHCAVFFLPAGLRHQGRGSPIDKMTTPCTHKNKDSPETQPPLPYSLMP
jgi:hypothetical protein